MLSLYAGIGITLFGLLIGGVGLASSGIGIGIPMVPLGIYLTYRGWRIYKHAEKRDLEQDLVQPLEPFEKTKTGKLGLGILLILIGLGTSAFIVGIPILMVGAFFIYSAYKFQILTTFKNINGRRNGSL